jgi:hypothetical protein
MDHLEAIRLAAVEKYLLNELSPEMRDEFEEHYFDCAECTTDLRATSVFIDTARHEFASHPEQRAFPSVVAAVPQSMKNRVPPPAPQTYPRKQSLVYTIFQRPTILAGALAASLLVIVYQNALVYPHLERQVAELRAPEVLPTLSLAGSNSRGGTMPSLTVQAAQPFLLAVDVPVDDRFKTFSCELHAPSGAVLWRVPVTAEAAKDLVTIHAPAIRGSSGRYTLVFSGISDGKSAGSSIELARDPFDLTVRP